MKWEISQSNGFNVIQLLLNKDDTVNAQPRSMLSMTTGISVKAQIGGEGARGLKIINALKGTLAGENFFTTEFKSLRDNEQLCIAPDAVGQMLEVNLQTQGSLMIAKGAFLAHVNGVTLTTKYAGMKGYFANKGLFLLKATGTGTLFLSSYGEIMSKSLADGEKYVIDNDYVLAFDETVSYELVTINKGLTNSFFSGEGLVNRYKGPGKVYYQTRSKVRSGLISSVIRTMT